MSTVQSLEYPESRRNVAGLGVVVGLHLVLGWGLANGLGRKVVEVLAAPLSVAIIEEPKPTPPPPPPPKLLRVRAPVTPPPPAYVPPPEVVVEAPPQPVIANVAPEPPPPPAPVVQAAPVAPPIVNAAVACPNSDQVRSRVPYPARAERLELSGSVLVEFTVGADGSVRNVAAVNSSNPIFTETATRAVSEFRCTGQGRDVRVRVPFTFRYG